MNSLPVGHHRGLDITHLSVATGAFAAGGWKLIWHTTEGDNFHAMIDVLRSKRAEPHCVIDAEHGRVCQLVPFDQYARALEHPANTPETNRAHCIQVEICGYARDSQHWSEHFYRNLARLALLIEHRVTIPRKSRHEFKVGAKRLTPTGFIKASGHLGHEHVPNQPSLHWDPGALKIDLLLHSIGEV